MQNFLTDALNHAEVQEITASIILGTCIFFVDAKAKKVWHCSNNFVAKLKGVTDKKFGKLRAGVSSTFEVNVNMFLFMMHGMIDPVTCPLS